MTNRGLKFTGRLWRAYVPMGLALILGVLLSVAAFRAVRESESYKAQAEFKNRAQRVLSALRLSHGEHTLILLAIERFYAASETVTRAEFDTFIHPMLVRCPCIGVAWVPRVACAQRDALEASAQNDGLTGFQFTELGAQGALVPAGRREEYFPSYFYDAFGTDSYSCTFDEGDSCEDQPPQTSGTNRGFDLGSSPKCLDTLLRARDTGKTALSPLVDLPRYGSFHPCLFAVTPIYKRNAPTNTVAARRENLAGFAVAFFCMDHIAAESLDRERTKKMALHIFDASDSSNPLPLYTPESEPHAALASTPDSLRSSQPYHFADTVDVENRKWLVVATAGADFREATPSRPAWGIFGAGLAITALLSGYFLLAARNGERSRRFAAEQAEANEKLEREVAARKSAQAKLGQYARELKQTNGEVKQFAYIVSHDLRAPVLNLRGFAGELRDSLRTLESPLEEALPHMPEEQRRQMLAAIRTDIPESLGFIDSAAARMDNLVNALLTLSRLGRRELAFEPVNLADVVKAALNGLAHQISERHIDVRVVELPHVMADRTAMDQVVGNLLANAVNYVDPDRPCRLDIGGEVQDGETSFFIRDTGRGISEADLSKLFMPFRRFGKQDVKGEGMGLACVQTLVRRHGGRIECESKLGAGTTFTVILANHPEQGEMNGPTEV